MDRPGLISWLKALGEELAGLNEPESPQDQELVIRYAEERLQAAERKINDLQEDQNERTGGVSG